MLTDLSQRLPIGLESELAQGDISMEDQQGIINAAGNYREVASGPANQLSSFNQMTPRTVINRQFKEARRTLYEQFDEMSVSYIPSETNFITIDVKTDAAEICSKLQNKGVIVRPLSMYDMPSFLRVSIGTMEQNESFIAAFKSIYGWFHRAF